MSISFSCKCGKKITVPADRAGQRGRCPKCNEVLVVPESASIQRIETTRANLDRAVSTEIEDRRVSGTHAVAPAPIVVPTPTVVYQQAPVYVQQPMPSIQQTVVVQQGRSRSNSLAVLALVFGIIGLFFSWLPGIGIALGVGVILVAGLGFVISLLRSGAGMVYAIFGGILGIAIVIVSVLTTSAAVITIDKVLTPVATERPKQ